MSCLSAQTQSLSPGALQPEEPGFSTVHLGKGLSDADDPGSLCRAGSCFLSSQHWGLGLADAVSSTHNVGFGSVLDLKWKPQAQTERRPSRKSLAYFKKSQIFKPSLHSLK